MPFFIIKLRLCRPIFNFHSSGTQPRRKKSPYSRGIPRCRPAPSNPTQPHPFSIPSSCHALPRPHQDGGPLTPSLHRNALAVRKHSPPTSRVMAASASCGGLASEKHTRWEDFVFSPSDFRSWLTKGVKLTELRLSCFSSITKSVKISQNVVINSNYNR